MKSIAIVYISVLFLLFVDFSSGVLNPNQATAISNLKTEYSQTWDLSNICLSNPVDIVCDSTETVIVELVITFTGSYTLSNSIYALVNLTSLTLPNSMAIPNSIWNSLNSLPFLNTLKIDFINTTLPSDLGSFFPNSLTKFIVSRSSQQFPTTLFTNTKLKSVSIGASNFEDYVNYPSSIPSPSLVEEITVTNYGSFNMVGTNFNNLKKIDITHKLQQITYDSYHTFTALEILVMTISSIPSLPPSQFPNSLFNLTNLRSLTITDQTLMVGPPVLDFSRLPYLNLIYLSGLGGVLSNIVYPGIIISPRVLNKVDLSIYYANIYPSKFNWSVYKTVSLASDTFEDALPEQDYSNIDNFYIVNNYDKPLPNALCQVKNGITVSNTAITTVPDCFICDWGGSTNVFLNNLNLPVYVQVCPSFSITNNTRLIDTAGGTMIIDGVNLGYVVYKSNGDPFGNQKVLIGNSKLTMEIPSGTGKGYAQLAKFHYAANNSVPFLALNYAYYPPLPNAFQATGVKSVNIVGKYFGDNAALVDVMVAGEDVTLTSVSQTSIELPDGVVHYTKDLVLSVRVTVNTQETLKVITPHGYNPLMNSPLPVLYSTGGLVEFSGQYLTYDTTIMNMTVNGLLFSNNITDSTSTVLIIKYDPIPSGSYNFVYNQNGYQLIDTITVKDPPSSGSPCKGTPVCGGPQQGQCINSHCECLNGWLGEQCDSKPTVIPPPLEPDTQQPNFNTSTEEIALHVSIQSIRELSFDGTQLREQPIEQWKFSQNSTDEKKRYTYEATLFTNCKIQVTVDYFLKDSIVSFAGQNSTKLAGSIKYSAKITDWPFTQKTNQLQLIFSSIIQDQSSSSSSCSYKAIEYEDNQIKDSIKKVNIQVNGNTFSTEFSGLAVIDGINRKIKNSLVPTSEEDTNTQSTSLVGITTPYHNEYIIIDPDFSLLVSYVPPEDKEGSVCSTSKSKLTTAELAGIIVASAVVGLVIIATIIYFTLSKNLKAKLLLYSIKSKVTMK
ncbi:EGF-like domain-containing protein [Tieghemostelium lacteum]|uniref:EGF-like domain-containing protein n=1 Tax=Tieghemostelium lacteum TaxID=361077 RepID=A0A151ZI76_TIELA|nr:EGF-like domain-containing protein [Tieghemostelium lacteum]|eukprot:KYQ93615.1 EGF-like domain-containing protein [Tieghemostelium lacteum]